MKIIIAILFVSMSGKVSSQDLLSRVPEDSKVVVAINSKGFFKNANINQLNTLLKKVGFFKAISSKNNTFNSDNIEELGIDFNAKSYSFFGVNDSLYYIGGLIPLKDKLQFESILPDDDKIEVVNGYNTVYSIDKKIRLSWDQQAIYILSGIVNNNYFRRSDIMERYGIVEASVYDWDELSEVEDMVIDEVDSTYSDFDYPTVEDEFAYADSILAQDEYQDDYYLTYRRVNEHNDSVKNEFVQKMVNIELERIISGKQLSYRSKAISAMKDNELLRMEVQNIDSLIAYNYPLDLISPYYISQPTFNFGIEKITNSIIVDANKMKLVGEVELDKEMAKYYKKMYKKGLSRKLSSFLNDETIGFLSLNLNTEAYIKHMPSIINRVYGAIDMRYSPVIDLATTVFDVVVDEKSLAKVFKGDNLFILNGVSQKEVKYIDYEYDDDYNYIEVEKTKTENNLNFMWVFSSDDTRIFEKIIKVLENDDAIINHDGIFEIKKSRKKEEFGPYILMGNGMVFLGNDLEQLQAIKANNFKSKEGSRFNSYTKNSSYAMVLNTKKVPSLVEELGFPIKRTMYLEIKNLEQYGDVYIKSRGVKRNSFRWESGVELPNTGVNALDFILHSLDNMISH